MVKKFRTGPNGPSIPCKSCPLCNATHGGPTDLCISCDKCLKRMSDSNASDTDREIMQIMREPRARERAAAVEKLGRLCNKSFQKL